MKRSVRIALGVGLLLLACIAAWLMWQRSRDELLWGYRTLVMLFGFYGGLVLLFQPLLFKKGTPWRWLGLSGLSILLLSIGFPDYIPAPFLLFAGFVPLLILEREISETDDLKKGWTLWRYAYVTFVGWNIITTFWVSNSAISAGLFAILANSALMTLPFLLFHHTKRHMPKLGYASFIAYWLSWEYGHLNWDLTWPWLTLGNGFAEWPSWVQWYEYTGVFGGSLWILLGNVLLLQAWTRFRERKKWQVPAARFAALVILPLALSQVLYYSYQDEGRPVKVLVVQPNYEPFYVKFTKPPVLQVREMEELADSLLAPDTRYVVYPESAISNYNIREANRHPAIIDFRDHFQDRPGLNLVLGMNAHEILEPPGTGSDALRVFVNRRGDTTYYESSNAAGQFVVGAPEVQVYKKSKLVPGPEIFPFQEVLGVFEPIVEKVGGTTAGLATQPKRTVMVSEAGKIGTLICYESVFGEYVTGYVRQGAEALFVMTNDGWWDNTPGHRQHLMFASLRAIETRRPVARSANTGISAFINQRGDIEESLEYNATGALQREMLFNNTPTFYLQWGDIIARIAAFLSAILILNTLVKRLSRRPTAS